ncbi:hypothetical protein IMSHALPRED_003975 [Imshaugia aleurites]|uniref:Uncharacterized protein n=1 Tax=Imshaugia aleurites TaxID=172621 RepID=A0A8H3EFW2_9LECA|nr:hypothetical protein IMSHALPRED_003975 [Imshaugia aleurites]
MTSTTSIETIGIDTESKVIQTPGGLGPFFKTLPQELRDIIFADCLASGYPQFMAASRAMRKEGSEQICKKGIFRMNFGIMVRLNLGPGNAKYTSICPQPRRDIANSIQNLSIRIKPTTNQCNDFWSNIDLDVLKQFAGPEVRRKSCKIMIDLRLGTNVIGNELFATMGNLAGFEKVELRMALSANTNAAFLQKPFPRAFTYFEMCSTFLSPNLGPGLMTQDEEGFLQSFSPRVA